MSSLIRFLRPLRQPLPPQKMKSATIKFSYVLDIAYPDHLDDEWVCEQFLRSERFSTLHFEGEPGIVEAASYGVEELRRCD